MAYTKTTWKDRIVEFSRRFTQTTDAGGKVTLVPDPGVITEEGTPVNASLLNKMEQGIANALPLDGSVAMTGPITSKHNVPLISAVTGLKSWVHHSSTSGMYYISPTVNVDGTNGDFAYGIHISPTDLFWAGGSLNGMRALIPVDNDGSAMSVADLNADLKTGWYRGALMANRPREATDWVYVEVVRHDPLYCVQTAYDYYSNRRWVRYKIGGVWALWEILHDETTTALAVYVDSQWGNDAYDGKAAGSPFKTIARAMKELPKVSKRDRQIIANGTFDEEVVFDGFVGGTIGIWSPNQGSVTCILRKLTFSHCVVDLIRVYHLSVGYAGSGFLGSNFPLNFEYCNAFINCATVDTWANIYGLTVSNCSGMSNFNAVKVGTNGSNGGTAFSIDYSGNVLLHGCTCPATYPYGITSTASVVFAQTAGIVSGTPQSKSQGGQIFAY